MGNSLASLAVSPARFNVPTQNVQSRAQSRVRRALNHALGLVHTKVYAPCLVPFHATKYLARCGVIKIYPAVTGAQAYAENHVQSLFIVIFVQVVKLKTE